MEIQLHPHGVALIDADDYALVSAYRWNLERAPYTNYAIAHPIGQRRGTVRMHRLILGLTDRRISVDHANHNGLDNRRANLRPATRGQQAANSTRQNKWGFRGVYYDAAGRRFQAEITANGKRIRLGYYKEASDAARAYDEAARVSFGEFATLNFALCKEGQ